MKNLITILCIIPFATFAQKKVKIEWKFTDSTQINYDLIIDMTSAIKKENALLNLNLKDRKLTKSDSVNFKCEVSKRDSEVAQVKMFNYESVLLNGTFYLKGGIESYFIENRQRSLLSAMFEFPKKIISVGDEWELDFSSIYSKGNVNCEYANRKRTAKLESIKGDTAVIKYDIQEYAKGKFESNVDEHFVLDTKLIAIGYFLLSKGRWVYYELNNYFLIEKNNDVQLTNLRVILKE